MYELVQQQTFEFSLISHQEHVHITCAAQAAAAPEAFKSTHKHAERWDASDVDCQDENQSLSKDSCNICVKYLLAVK